MGDVFQDAGGPVEDPVEEFWDDEPDPGETPPERVPRGWSRADAEMLVEGEIAGSVARSEWLRDVRAAQVAREWAGIEEQLPMDDIGMVKWAGQGVTPESGLVLSAPASVDSSTDFGDRSSRRFATSSISSDLPDVTDWLDRLYGPPDTGPITVTNGVPEYDLGPLGRVRRSGIAAHASNDPGRFRDLVALEAEHPRRGNWPARKSIVLPVAVIVSLAGLGAGRTALEAVQANEQVTLADPPLLMGQKAPSGTLATVPPEPKSTPKSQKTSSSFSPASGGKHVAPTPPPAGSTVQPVAPGTKTPPEPPSNPVPQRPRTSITTYSTASPGNGSLTSSTAPPTSGGKKGSRPQRHKGRHRKPDLKKPGCDPNYSFACVPVASDVDCANSGGDGPAYLASAAKVIGKDIYKLDTDGDGWVCERW